MARIVAVALVASLAFACGGPLPPEARRSKARSVERAAEGKTGSEATRDDADEDKVSGRGKQWGGWRYTGSRDSCFFMVGRACFESEKDACEAAKCGAKKCVADGGGPATMRCR
ncbi:MAG: hypothetical protein R3B06_22980 [Kofleriaceae bacterium]